MRKQTAAAYTLEAPSLGLLAAEPLRAVLEFCAAKLAPAPARVGDGHPVIVYPGLGGGALTTAHLRSHLQDCGFEAVDWGCGVNSGPSGSIDDWLASLVAAVRELRSAHGRKVSLVGWSLGGVYAREIAKLCPQDVRQVVTLATPFGALHDANHAGTVFKMLGGDTSQLTPELRARLVEPPPVPSTSIYSKTDGLVCWKGCMQAECAGVQNVEVNASHLGMATHPEVLRVLVDRLVLREGEWRPYRATRTRRVKAAIAPRPSSMSPAR